MKKLIRASQLLLLPFHLTASNQIFEAGSVVRIEEPSAGMNEAYWLFDSSNHYFGHYPPQAAATQGYSSYFEEGSYTLNSLGNNQFSAQLSSTAYATVGYSGGTGSASRAATVTLSSPFSATYSGTRSELGTSSSFNGSLTIYPAQDYAPDVIPIGSVWDSNNEYYYSAAYSGPGDGDSYTILSSSIVEVYDPDTGVASGSYTYTKLGPNFGRVAISSPENNYSASINLFFRSPYEVYFYGNSTDYYGTYTDWGAFSVSYPPSYSPPAIFPAPTSLPQNQILQITGTNSDLSLNLAEGTWTDVSGGSGSFTYTYSLQSGGVAGLTLNRTGQNAPAIPEHFALRFTDGGVGEVVYSSLDGSQNFNLVAAPTWELYDDFSGSTLDTQKWETWYWPGGRAPLISNGQLKLENGGGSGRKDPAFLSNLQSAGFDVSSRTYHSGVVFSDPSIIGIEADLFLPAGVAPDSGVFIDLFEQVSFQEIRNAGVELGYWGGSQADLWFAKSAYSSGSKTSVVEETQYVTLGQSYRVRMLRQNGSIKLYRDDVLVQTHAAEGELLAFFIGAFNDSGQSMYAMVDNVRVLRDTTIGPPLPVIESYGNTELLGDSSGYYAGSASTPLLYNGRQVSSSYPNAAYTVAGVDQVNGSYRLVMIYESFFGGIQYYAANFSFSGSNTSALARVSDILAEEVNLQQDFDGDGHVGTPPIALPVIESYGNTELLGDSSGYYAGSASTPLLYNGRQVSSSYPNAAYTVAGVDQVNGSYRLVMIYESFFGGIQYYAANFSFSGSNTSALARVSDILAEEVNLQQDFDGDGHVGTPLIAPPASLAGKSFVVTQLTGGSKSVPDQITFTADTFSYGFSGNLRASGVSYTYSNGTMVYGIEERIDFAFTSSTEGTYEAGEVGPDGTFYIENTGTFEEANISFSLQTNWQRTETMDSELSTNYWQIESTSGDSAVYNDGELNFTFDPSSDPDPLAAYSEEQEIKMHYAGALPLDEDWQIVIDDTYVSDSVNQFAMGYQIMFQRSLYCEFGFLDQTSGRGVYFYADSYNSDTNQTDYYGDYYRPVVSNIADPRMQNGLNFRIQHLANTRELVYSYQPDGASDWTEVARINLSTGAATGLSGSGSLSGQLPSSSENLRFGVDIDKYSTEAILIENIEIGGIEIGTFTPPIIPVDSDGDGLDDSVETNTGVYVSPSDTGTNSQLLDSSGDGFTDGEMVSAGYDPNINYSQIINILGQNPSRFGLVDPLSIVDAQLGQLSLEQGIDGNFDMNFDLEMSTDLQTWAPHSSHTIEISIPDQTKTFMRLNVK